MYHSASVCLQYDVQILNNDAQTPELEWYMYVHVSKKRGILSIMAPAALPYFVISHADLSCINKTVQWYQEKQKNRTSESNISVHWHFL